MGQVCYRAVGQQEDRWQDAMVQDVLSGCWSTKGSVAGCDGVLSMAVGQQKVVTMVQDQWRRCVIGLLVNEEVVDRWQVNGPHLVCVSVLLVKLEVVVVQVVIVWSLSVWALPVWALPVYQMSLLRALSV